LDQHLRSVGILSGLDDMFINQLRNRVELLTYKKGDVIVKEGDQADAFYLIRFGNVKVSKSYAGGDLVLNYLGRSEFFGERGGRSLSQGHRASPQCVVILRNVC
jgi:CRP-like cAMP-binding protein